MTESRIPRDLVRAIAIEYIKESKRLGGEIDGLSNALDAHLDELAALVQPAATVHEVTAVQIETAAEAARRSYSRDTCVPWGRAEAPRREEWREVARAVLATLQPAADQTEPNPDALPRPITREEMREGQVVELATTVRYRVGPATTGYPALSYHSAQSGWSLVADAPNPDAALIDALAESIAADDGRPLEDCAEESVEQYRGNARAVLAVLRERCDITPRGEQ